MKASVEHLRSTFAFSERKACRLVGVAVSSFRYRGWRCDDGLREDLIELARQRPRFGYRRLHVLLGQRDIVVNHKRVWRVYREAGLAVKRRKRKRLVRLGVTVKTVLRANEEWALDFVSDAIASGRRIRLLSVVDAFTRECLSLEVDTSFASPRVTRELDRIIAERGRPQRIRCDNGPELTSRHFLA
jgi:putative transposase